MEYSNNAGNDPTSSSNAMTDDLNLESETSSVRLTSAVTSQSNHSASAGAGFARPKVFIYQTQVRGMKHDNSQTLYVDFEHVARFDESLARAIVEHFYRYLQLRFYFFKLTCLLTCLLIWSIYLLVWKMRCERLLSF